MANFVQRPDVWTGTALLFISPSPTIEKKVILNLLTEVMGVENVYQPASLTDDIIGEFENKHLIDNMLGIYVEPKLNQPTFLVDYPIEMSPLAKTKPGNNNIVERFEAFAGCMEIANAFSELNDPLEQEQRFILQAQLCHGEDEESAKNIDYDFLKAMAFGMPPTGGLGLGIDRLIMLLANQSSIRDVILFPQLKERG